MEKLTFFDFCSGIGGGRIALENNGLECVGHCEIDEITSKTYEKFFDDNRNYGDLTKLDITKLPQFDFMIAGFPCQTFSIAGKRKGFEDERGKIIHYLINILKIKKIKLFLFENVKGLINHNKGETIRTIKKELEEIGYKVYYKVLNSIDYGVPQSRERVYIVGFKNDIVFSDFEFPKKIDNKYVFEEFINCMNENIWDINNITFNKYLNNKYNKGKINKEKILLWNNTVIDWRQSDLRKYFEYFPTLRTSRHGLLYVRNNTIYKLSGYEALLLQGFPKNIAKKVKEDKFFSNNKVLSQAGNAMTVTVIDKIIKNILKSLK